MKSKPEKPKPSVNRGPKPEVLTIPGKWEDAVKISLGKKKPAGGWPK